MSKILSLAISGASNGGLLAGATMTQRPDLAIVALPAVGVMADHDDRVVPAHSFKFAATLQENHKGNNPVLIRVDVKSGHGSSNLSKALDVVADQYSFTYYNMGIEPPLTEKSM